MKLSDDEAILFGTMMWIGGFNAGAGRPAISLEVVDRDEVQAARAQVMEEFERFKSLAKKRRRMQVTSEGGN
jgi:hypothetical protein